MFLYFSLDTGELANSKVAVHFDDGSVDTIVADGEKLTGIYIDITNNF